jgi:hypothetical protein
LLSTPAHPSTRSTRFPSALSYTVSCTMVCVFEKFTRHYWELDMHHTEDVIDGSPQHYCLVPSTIHQHLRML